MDNNVITTLAVAVTAVIARALTMYDKRQRLEREDLHRKWDHEDRAANSTRLSAELSKQATVVSSALSEHSVRVAQANSTQTVQVLGKIAENTKVAAAAFNEANGTNAKIAALHVRIDTVVTDMNMEMDEIRRVLDGKAKK